MIKRRFELKRNFGRGKKRFPGKNGDVGAQTSPLQTCRRLSRVVLGVPTQGPGNGPVSKKREGVVSRAKKVSGPVRQMKLKCLQPPKEIVFNNHLANRGESHRHVMRLISLACWVLRIAIEKQTTKLI